MTAPGNSALLFSLLAVFVACCGYAAGRIHQRRQMEDDREEAYRDGYDTATRSVFSLAARVIAPRRAIRGSATPQPVVDGSVVSEPPAGAGAGPLGAAPAGPLARAEPLTPAVRLPTGPLGVAGSPARSGLSRPSAVPGAAPTPEARVSSPAETDPAPLGFPAPPPPSPRIVVEPPAVGGVVYRPFPDPRVPLDVVLPPDEDAHRRIPAPSGPSQMPRAAEIPPESSGRHTVPDELVQATTYRLPPDRVFRAKVPEGVALPEEPTTRLSVPKPRQS